MRITKTIITKPNAIVQDIPVTTQRTRDVVDLALGLGKDDCLVVLGAHDLSQQLVQAAILVVVLKKET